MFKIRGYSDLLSSMIIVERASMRLKRIKLIAKQKEDERGGREGESERQIQASELADLQFFT